MKYIRSFKVCSPCAGLLSINKLLTKDRDLSFFEVFIVEKNSFQLDLGTLHQDKSSS